MKKLWKMTTAAVFLCAAVCLCSSMNVFAEKVSGTTDSDISWSLDQEEGLLTMEGSGMIGAHELVDNWSDHTKRIILNGCINFESNIRDEAEKKEIISNVEGFSWRYCAETNTLTLSGEGEWPEDYYWLITNPGTIVIEDGITHISFHYLCARHMVLGKNVSIESSDGKDIYFTQTVHNGFEVHPENPYYASYMGGLYSKDFSTLIDAGSYPPYKLHPDLKVVSGRSLHVSAKATGDPVVFPWGATTLLKNALSHAGVFVLPDTITEIDPSLGEPVNYHKRQIIFSANNEAAKKVFKNIPDTDDFPAETKVIILNSLSEYYPDIPEAQAPAGSSVPSEPPQGSSESVSSSAPPEIEPSEEPAESSEEIEESSESSESGQISAESSENVKSEPSAEQESSEPSESETVSAEEVPAAPAEKRKTGWVVPVLAMICGAAAAVLVLLKRKI